MAVNDRKTIGAGFTYAFYGINDSDGFCIGAVAGGAVAGAAAGSPMLRLLGVKVSNLAIPEAENVIATGDDGPLANFLFPAADLPAGTIEAAIDDLDLAALIQGTLVENVDDLSLGVLQPDAPDFADMSLILQSRAKSQTSGTVGAKRWSGWFISSAQGTPLDRDNFTERAVGTTRYSITVSPADKSIYGSTMNPTVSGTTRASARPFTAANPVHMHPFKGDNSRTAFTLAYLPVSDAKVSVYVEGTKLVLTTAYTVNTSTGVVTFVSAPAQDARVNVLYEFVI